MNIIKMFELGQLQLIVDDLLHLSGELSEEIYHNMWCISFEDDLIKSIKIDQLKHFVDAIMENREQQLKGINFRKNVVFYIWFDQQALQLRFNVLTGDLESLPFGCKVHIVKIVDPILNNFIDTTRNVIQCGDQIRFFDKTDDDWDDDENEEEYVLDVFAKKLNK